MSTNSESWIPTYDIAEELVNNAVDDVPFAKDIWIISNKCFSIRKLRGTLKDGREKLHEGGELLCRPDVQAALEGRQMYKDLCDTYFELEAVAQNLEQQIDGLKFYQFKKKYTIHVNAAHWKADSYRYMVTVRVTSTSARLEAALGLNPHNGMLPTADETPQVTASGSTTAQETGDLESPSTLTLVAGDISDSAHDEDEVGAGSHSHPVYVIEISDTHSVFGNHWAGCEVDIESPSNSDTVFQPGTSID